MLYLRNISSVVASPCDRSSSFPIADSLTLTRALDHHKGAITLPHTKNPRRRILQGAEVGGDKSGDRGRIPLFLTVSLNFHFPEQLSLTAQR